MANNATGFFTKETKDGKKHKIPILGRIIEDREKRKDKEFELNDENIQGLTGYSDQHRQAIMLAAQKLQMYQQGYSANYSMAMEDVRYLHSLLLKGVDTHGVYQLLMSNPQGAASYIKNMGLSNVVVADATYNPRRSNLVASFQFQKSSVPVANLGIIPIGGGLFMGLADKSTFYYLIKPNKDAQGVLYPISTMKPTDLSKTLAQLSKPEYIDQVLAYLQQFNSSVGGLVGSGATAPQAQMPQGMSMGGSFDNPNAAQPEIQQMSVPPGMEQAMGAQPNGNQDKGSSSFGAKETSKELVSGVDDLKLSNEDNLRIRNYVGGKGAGAARSLAQYASLAYGISTTQAAMYIANASGTNTAVGEQLRRLGNQLKAGKFKPAFKFISKVQDALVGNFVKSNASLDLPNNPSEFASIVQSDPKIKDKWTDFTSDNNETSEAFTEYLEERDDEDEDEDDGKN